MAPRESKAVRVSKTVTQEVEFRVEGVSLRDLLLSGLMARVVESFPRATSHIMILEAGKQSFVLSDYSPFSGTPAVTIKSTNESPEFESLVEIVRELAGRRGR